MIIVGISAYYHDAAACLVIDGEIIAAAQEERFTRRKHDADFPGNAINYCLSEAGIDAAAVDYFCFYDKPFLKFERILETYLAFAPAGLATFRRSAPTWVTEKLFQKHAIAKALRALLGKHVDWESRLLFSEHHLSHAASAFFPSPFENAAILTMDGVGEWTTTSLAVGAGNDLTVQREIRFPHSLGLLYSAVTYHTGFEVNGGEYKVMGLAPYGSPTYADTIRSHLIDVQEDGSFHLNMDYFDYCSGSTMTNPAFDQIFGGPPRRAEGALTQRDMDLAASIQVVIEDIVLKLAREAARSTGERNLCLAGGVALNCVANGKLLREGPFERLWIQPAAGDAGGAIGAALGAYHLHRHQPRVIRSGRDGMNGALLGPHYSQAEIVGRLDALGCIYTIHPEAEMIDIAARALADGDVIGWHQGRMEFGPRALGARSILADPRSPSMQRKLNLKVKNRESFRPFAPSVLREHVSEWFDLDTDSPYMLLVAEVAPERRCPLSAGDDRLRGLAQLDVQRSTIPAVTHIDHSARIQTVDQETNPLYHALIEAFLKLTGCPILVNTSFNMRDEPIVSTPDDAFRCFMQTDIDLLIVGNAMARKSAQTAQTISSAHAEHAR